MQSVFQTNTKRKQDVGDDLGVSVLNLQIV